jgi:hypothetical protein
VLHVWQEVWSSGEQLLPDEPELDELLALEELDEEPLEELLDEEALLDDEDELDEPSVEDEELARPEEELEALEWEDALEDKAPDDAELELLAEEALPEAETLTDPGPPQTPERQATPAWQSASDPQA